MPIHLLQRRRNPKSQYAKVGIQGFAICGPPVSLEEIATEDPGATTCEQCLAMAAGVVEKALGEEGEVHFTLSPFITPKTAGVCGFKRRPGEPGVVSTVFRKVTCVACRAIGEA